MMRGHGLNPPGPEEGPVVCSYRHGQ